MSKHRLLLFVLLLVTLSVPARAQERGQVGVAMGYPTVFGVMWHVSDALALRPELNVAHGSSETDLSVLSGVTTSTDSWSFGTGLSALWYFGTDNVRPYLCPRFAYDHSSGDVGEISFSPETNRYAVSLAFGAQYAPTRKFSVYGEMGYGYTRSTIDLQTPIGTSSGHASSWGLRSAAGVIFYFGK